MILDWSKTGNIRGPTLVVDADTFEEVTAVVTYNTETHEVLRHVWPIRLDPNNPGHPTSFREVRRLRLGHA